MKFAEVIKELDARGYEAEEKEVVRNGVVKKGILMQAEGNMRPVIYIDTMIEDGFSVEEISSAVIGIFEKNKKSNFGTSLLTDPDYILSNCYVAFQRQSDEGICKRNTEFSGIEQYLYVKIQFGLKEGSIKITQDLLGITGLDVEEVFERATQNTCVEAELINFSSIIGLSHMDDFSALVITNRDRYMGASAILNRQLLTEAGKTFGTNVITCIPSSIHEWILLPHFEDNEAMPENALIEMITSVNEEAVEEEEWLGNRPYYIHLLETV